jgi:hypothetical protein
VHCPVCAAEHSLEAAWLNRKTRADIRRMKASGAFNHRTAPEPPRDEPLCPDCRTLITSDQAARLAKWTEDGDAA